MRITADAARAALEADNRVNREKQARHRAAHSDEVRSKDRARISDKRAAERTAKQKPSFVAIDAAGCNIGDPYPVLADDA
jgi:hypothetical protein